MSALLLERHDWETSASEHQLQIPKEAFGLFFGSPGSIDVYVCMPPNSGASQHRQLLLSYYAQSDTYRCNWLTDFGSLGHAVIIFEGKGHATPTYDLWWFTGSDAQTILSLPYGWSQARANQYMPQGGRKWTIISASAPRTV